MKCITQYITKSVRSDNTYKATEKCKYTILTIPVMIIGRGFLHLTELQVIQNTVVF